jgi:hypothetical protein
VSLRSFILAMICAAVAFAAPDLASVKAEPNLARRSVRALANADHAIDAAHEFYNAGDIKKAGAELDEVGDSVELCFEALTETGKHPRSSPKHFKHAELSIGDLLRRLKSFESDVSVDDRPLVERAEHRLQQVRDDLLSGIMGKKK